MLKMICNMILFHMEPIFVPVEVLIVTQIA